MLWTNRLTSNIQNVSLNMFNLIGMMDTLKYIKNSKEENLSYVEEESEEKKKRREFHGRIDEKYVNIKGNCFHRCDHILLLSTRNSLVFVRFFFFGLQLLMSLVTDTVNHVP